MSRYIDAEALKEKFINTDANGINLAIDRYALKCIEDTPSIDIVWCKECKWHGAKMIPKSVRCIAWHKADDYCSYGERREP